MAKDLALAKRLLIIRNPTAGQCRARDYASALALFEQAGCAVTVSETSARGDAVRIARDADEAAFDAVVAAGGDGTINEVVNGLAGRKLPLGVIPLGTSNVLAHEIGVGPAIGRSVETILTGRPTSIAAADAGGNLCCLMLSAGSDARAVARVRPALKSLLGEGAYYIAGLEEIIVGPRRMLQVEADGEIHEAATVVVMNGRLYGGKYLCSPESDMRDPVLHVILLTRPGRWNTIRYGLALVTGRLHRLHDVQIIPATKVRIAGPKGEPCQTDGDLIGETPIDIAIRPNAIEILYPVN